MNWPASNGVRKEPSQTAEAREEMNESPKGFITAPSLEQLQPTKREKHLLKVLWEWQEQSKRSPLVLGEPTKAKAKEKKV